MDDARFVTEILLKAYENYTVQPQPRLSAFPCENTGRTNPRPINARRLLPGDIDIVIAMGDSLTAGFGADASSIFDLFTDYRATSFSIGSNEGVDTLVNSMYTMNQNIEGFSVGNGDAESVNAGLNVAVTGAESHELLVQVEILKEKIANYNPALWKHLTLFIGGNDLCNACNAPDDYLPQRFQANIEATLDAIKSHFRNIFISIVVPPDVTLLSELTGGLCSILRPFECSCNGEESTALLHKEYVNVLHVIEALPKYDQDAHFYVSVQPFLELIHLPLLDNGDYDKSYFAPDCFHFSRKSHSAAGLALWNNLMEPKGRPPTGKRRDWVVGEPFKCPAPGQYLQ